jgi:RND family efflux transporter MFP subunit
MVMSQEASNRADAVRATAKQHPRYLSAALAVALLAPTLSGCNDRTAAAAKPAALVRTEIVQPSDRQTSITLTGEVQARFRADLAFRVSGRVIARLVDVGAHVNAGAILALLDPAEQQAEVDAAAATVAAAQAELRLAKATFDRQSYLISTGFTTRAAFDQAQEGLRTAQGSLDAAEAQLGTAKDILGYTELRADADGVITARNLEVGQVVQAAQPVFTLAHDGERDAIFDVYESIFFGEFAGGAVPLRLVSDPGVTAIGYVREVSPVVDQKSSTVRVKVAIQNPPATMTLGSPVSGTGQWKPVAQITLPWTALMAVGSRPAVWVIEPATKAASLKPVTIAGYEADAVMIKDGLAPGDRVVIDGGKLLSAGERVIFEGDRS